MTTRTAPTSPIIAIPSRMASTRLPNKPLADICGAPMVVRVWEKAIEANVGPVIVACAEQEIADVIEARGGVAVLTDPALPSGSDRVFAAIEQHDPEGRFDAIINLQGDLPMVTPESLRAVTALLSDPMTDIGTPVARITDPNEINDHNIVKPVLDIEDENFTRARAIYFTRATAPWGEGPLFHHVGIYSWRRDALAKFVAAPPSWLEKRERLEQLRAIPLGLRIDTCLIDAPIPGVDTAEGLEVACKAWMEREQASIA